MPAPTEVRCQGRRYLGPQFAPIGSERRRSPPPASSEPWSTGILRGPTGCRHRDQGLLLEFLDPVTWNEHRGCLPTPATHQHEPPSPGIPECCRGGRPRSRPTTAAAFVGPAPDAPGLMDPAARVRMFEDLIEDATDRGPDPWALRGDWHRGVDTSHLARSQGCPIPRCLCGLQGMPAAPSGPQVGGRPATPGGGSSPIPSRWNITRTQKGENGGSINVTSTSLDGALLLLKSAVADPGWSSPQDEAKGDIGSRSGRARE